MTHSISDYRDHESRWHIPVTPTFGRCRQEGHQFEVSLSQVTTPYLKDRVFTQCEQAPSPLPPISNSFSIQQAGEREGERKEGKERGSKREKKFICFKNLKTRFMCLSASVTCGPRGRKRGPDSLELEL